MSTALEKQKQEAATASLSPSERFTNAVIKEFSANPGDLEITNFQKKLCQNYFIKLDALLKENEQKRLSQREDKRGPVAFTWENVNMQKLSVDVISHASIGLDPIQSNHINLIPFLNSKTGKFDIGFLIGYVGLELKAKKYGYQPPKEVVIEVVYANDVFIPLKKDKKNPIETYEFDQPKPFDRGDVVGGFYYLEFDDTSKNKLRTFSLKDIEKRKPKHASAEFWGGEKDKWVDGKKNGKETIEGWFDEMVYKTIARAAFNAIPIDSEKIDEHFLNMLTADADRQPAELGTVDKVAQEINIKGNTENIDFEDANVVTEEKQQQLASGEQSQTKQEPNVQQKQPETVQKASEMKVPSSQVITENNGGLTPSLGF